MGESGPQAVKQLADDVPAIADTDLCQPCRSAFRAMEQAHEAFDCVARKLVVNNKEADLVRHIYQRYLEPGSVVELADDLNRQGHRTKLQHRTSTGNRGGCIFRRGTLYHLLSNRIYIGQMVHKGEYFAGEHPAFIDIDLWEAVQAKLKDKACGTSRRLKSQQPSLLVGLVSDGEGRAMTPSHSTNVGRRYRYYVTRSDQLDDAPAWRVSAHDLERLVCERLSDLLMDKQVICDLADGSPAEIIQRALAEAHQAKQLILANPEQSIAAIASRHRRCRTRLGNLAALGCLAPDIVNAIVEGRQPAALTARTLQDIDLPLAWTDQRALLGFA